MSIEIEGYEELAQAAVDHFWDSRQKAKEKQAAEGKNDQGERSAVTAGKNMDGFLDLVREIVKKNGPSDLRILTNSRLLTLPGYFRPTKNWDMLIMHKKDLVAVLEFKSQVGPSFGNNFNNRCEEAIGSATDLATAFREGSLGNSPRPFVGFLMMVEDCANSRASVKIDSPYFPVFKEFEKSSYAKRYEILCRKLVLEGLYSETCLLLSSRDKKYSEPSPTNNLKRFLAGLAAHVAAAGV